MNCAALHRHAIPDVGDGIVAFSQSPKMSANLDYLSIAVGFLHGIVGAHGVRLIGRYDASGLVSERLAGEVGAT
jgi:hypothetical protein